MASRTHHKQRLLVLVRAVCVCVSALKRRRVGQFPLIIGAIEANVRQARTHTHTQAYKQTLARTHTRTLRGTLGNWERCLALCCLRRCMMSSARRRLPITTQSHSHTHTHAYVCMCVKDKCVWPHA